MSLTSYTIVGTHCNGTLKVHATVVAASSFDAVELIRKDIYPDFVMSQYRAINDVDTPHIVGCRTIEY